MFSPCLLIVKGGEHGWVDHDGIAEERPHDLLHFVDYFGWQERRRVAVLCVFYMRPIGWFCPGVWGVLWAFGRCMLEFEKGCLEIIWHGDVAGA